MEQELWTNGDGVVIAEVYDKGHIEVESITFYDYQEFLMEMQRYGYKLLRR